MCSCTFLAVAGFAAGSALGASWSGSLRAALEALPEAFEAGAGAASEAFLLSGFAADVLPLQTVGGQVSYTLQSKPQQGGYPWHLQRLSALAADIRDIEHGIERKR